jgi:hypothetical protein
LLLLGARGNEVFDVILGKSIAGSLLPPANIDVFQRAILDEPHQLFDRD